MREDGGKSEALGSAPSCQYNASQPHARDRGLNAATCATSRRPNAQALPYLACLHNVPPTVYVASGIPKDLATYNPIH